MNSDYDITLVEKYFDQELTDVEVIEFNNRLATDRAFKAFVDQEKTLIKGIRAEGLHRDLQYLKSVERSLKHPSAGLYWPGKRWHYVAAAAVILFIVTVGAWMYSSRPTSEELFAMYFDKPYPNVFEQTLRGTPEYNVQHTEAFQAYDRGDYTQAASQFTEMLKTKKDPRVLLLLGNANLMLNRADEAQQNFLTLLNDFDELDLQAKWFLSLCYLKKGETEQARKMLKELGETEVSYASKAKELLKKVD